MKKYLHAKIHQARITQLNPEYEGSITIDANLLEASGIEEYESVLVAGIESGKRFETYVIEGESGSGIIGVNGAAANMGFEMGERLIIMAFSHGNRYYKPNPKIVTCNEKNAKK